MSSSRRSSRSSCSTWPPSRHADGGTSRGPPIRFRGRRLSIRTHHRAASTPETLTMIATTRRDEKARDSLRTRWAGVLLAALAALGTAAAYLIWLGWHASKDIHPDGSQTGPYEAWQVVGLVLDDRHHHGRPRVDPVTSWHRSSIPPTLTILWSVGRGDAARCWTQLLADRRLPDRRRIDCHRASRRFRRRRDRLSTGPGVTEPGR